MKSTVVGSFPVEVKEPSSAKDKLLNAFGAYDPFKEAIKSSVISQLDAGVDIISDGQVIEDIVWRYTVDNIFRCWWRSNDRFAALTPYMKPRAA